jgi:glutamate-1-semialdehyde aminotransferase
MQTIKIMAAILDKEMQDHGVFLPRNQYEKIVESMIKQTANIDEMVRSLTIEIPPKTPRK